MPRLTAPRKRKDRRSLRTLDPAYNLPPLPPAGRVTVVVAHDAGNDYTWFFSLPFHDGGTGGWTAADFAGLTVNGQAPVGVDEVAGDDGTVTLIYPTAAATLFAVNSAPPRLAFDGGATLLIPRSGAIFP